MTSNQKISRSRGNFVPKVGGPADEQYAYAQSKLRVKRTRIERGMTQMKSMCQTQGVGNRELQEAETQEVDDGFKCDSACR